MTIKNKNVSFKAVFISFLKDEEGATAIEYGLIAALIAVGIIAGARAIGTDLNGIFTRLDNEITNSM